MEFASRMSYLGAEGFSTVLAEVERLKSEGRPLIPMHAGEPDFNTPGHIVEAAVSALRAGDTHYVPAAGTMPLREAVAEEMAASRNVTVSPGQVIIAPGAKPVIYMALAALCQPGDEVICPNPGYPIYASLAAFLGARPISLPYSMEKGFSFDPDQLRALITPKTRMIVLNTPSNPTGGILREADLGVVAELAQKHNLFVLADEIYSDITYEQPFTSILSLPGMADRTILVDGYSKRFAMTGWRLGYGIVPTVLAKKLTRLALNIFSCTTSFIQPAGVAALQGAKAEAAEMTKIFRKRRDLIVEGLNQIPEFTCLAPQGAFYAFPRFRNLDMTSAGLSSYLLQKTGVVTYPGTAFGEHGEGFIRFSFACSTEQITQGLRLAAKAVGDLR